MASPPVDRALLDFSVDLVRRAGELTLEWFQSTTLAIEQKADGTPVTEADKAAERLLREALAEHHPDDSIVGEEEGSVEGTSGRTWIVDPIDGTKAFTRGVPLYSNLLAVEDEHGPAIGIINLPALGETVYAGRGLGCFFNDRPARVSAQSSLSGAYLTTSGYDYWPTAWLLGAKDEGMVLRTWGDGYGFALVATGRADVMLDPEAARWDLAPMPVILAEAGGRFTDLAGDPGSANGSGLATNGVLHDAVLDLVRRS